MASRAPVPAAVHGWHAVVASRDRAALLALLASEVVFRSPAVFTPQEGVRRASAYLVAALEVLGPTIVYEREWYAAGSAVLEFHARLGELEVHGIDLIAWDEADRITEFTVMVRPQRALAALVEAMGAALAG